MNLPSPLQPLNCRKAKESGIDFYIKREDLIDPEISGNKWRKLELNLQQAKEMGLKTLITFGGAYSNHLAATAKAGKSFGFKTIGIIRGEPHKPLNPTLARASVNGMQLNYINREQYRKKNSVDFQNFLMQNYGPCFIIPEGGANELGVNGCRRIMNEIHKTTLRFDYVFVACGTGTTAAGLALAAKPGEKIMAVSVLKNGDFLREEITNLLHKTADKSSAENALQKLQILTDYDFGGYAKYTVQLIDFMQDFFAETAIKLDPVYTAKAAFAMIDQVDKSDFRSKKVLLIHTGGLQGIQGFEQRHKLKIY